MPHDSADRARREVARNGGCATDGAPVMDFGEAAGRLVNCFTPIGLDAYHLIDLTCGAGNAFFVAITLALLATSANAQNCQFYGNQTHCDNVLSVQSAQPLR